MNAPGDTLTATQIEALRLTAHWRVARDALNENPYPTDRQAAVEQQRWDALVDFVEENDLNYTKYDPRGPE